MVLERLDRFNMEENAWREILVEDRHAGPAEVAATRIDFGRWLGILPRRLRKVAAFLAKGESTSDAAQTFGKSDTTIRKATEHARRTSDPAAKAGEAGAA